MALENPITVESDREQLTLREIEQLLNKYIQQVMENEDFGGKLPETVFVAIGRAVRRRRAFLTNTGGGQDGTVG